MAKKDYSLIKNFSEKINGKTYGELDSNYQLLVDALFDNTDLDSIFECFIIYSEQANLKLVYKGTEKYLIFRTQDETIMRFEDVDSITDKLVELGIEKNTANFMKFFHYGDNTMDGKGTKRMSTDEIKFKYHNEIAFYNRLINEDEKLGSYVEYLLFTDPKNDNYLIDMIVYTDGNYQVFATREEVISFVLENKSMYLKNIHFGCLSFQPFYRKVNIDDKEEKRDLTCIRWFNLSSSMSQIHFSRYFSHRNVVEENSEVIIGN